MHICIISPTAITDKTCWGGVHTHTRMLSKLLIKRKYKVTLITTDYQNKIHERKVNGIHIFFIPGIPRKVELKNWVKNVHKTFSRIHKENPIDCIFSEGYYAYGLQKSSTFKNLPIFSFIHNFHLVQFYNNWKEIEDIRSLGSYFFRTVPRLFFGMFRYEIPFYQGSRWVISVSKLNAIYLREIYRIPNHKLKVIHNWVETNKFTPDDSFRREYRQKFNISNNTLVFLLVGSLWRPKGFRIAIESFNNFVARFPDALLMIAGKGRDEETLKKLVSEKEPIKKRVQFLGFYSRSELPYLYNSADIFLMPSIISEGHPYTLTEAMSCGLPIIATRIGGNIELVGDAGILVQPGNKKSLTEAMISLAQDPEKRSYFSKSARNRVLENFSEEIAEKKILILIKESINDK